MRAIRSTAVDRRASLHKHYRYCNIRWQWGRRVAGVNCIVQSVSRSVRVTAAICPCWHSCIQQRCSTARIQICHRALLVTRPSFSKSSPPCFFRLFSICIKFYFTHQKIAVIRQCSRNQKKILSLECYYVSFLVIFAMTTPERKIQLQQRTKFQVFRVTGICRTGKWRTPRQSLRSVPTNIEHTSQHLNGVSAAAGAPGTDAAADALAAVDVNCSSSSELSACWLGSSTFRTVSPLLYSPPSLTETTCLLLTYVLTLCVNDVDHIVAPSPSNNAA